MELEFRGSGVGFGFNGIVGANHGTHGAPDTRLGYGCPLLDAVKGLKGGAVVLDPVDGGDKISLSENTQLNGVYRADSRTLTAQGASILFPVDLPGQVLET
jgi:hypothetical protein